MHDAPDIGALITRYAVLEERIHLAIRERSASHCSRCTIPCCDDAHCRDVAASAWLRRVADQVTPSGLDNIRQVGPARFLGPRGCRLSAGRPMQCTWYICDDLCLAIRDPLDRFAYQVISNLLGYVVRKTASDCDLVDVEDLDALSARQRQRIQKRIGEAEKCLDVVLSLQRERCETKPVGRLVEQVLYVCRTLPFAAKTVRFEGETPSLSAAHRPRAGQHTPE